MTAKTPKSISSYLADVNSNQRTVEQSTEAFLENIEAQNAHLNAFLSVTKLYAKRASSAIDVLHTHHPNGVGPLHGATISVKDLMDTSFAPTTYGSKRYKDHEPLQSAVVVQRLEQAHGVIVGKTNLHEFAYGITNENEYYGNAKNPVDPDRMTGGSSGGSAASVRAGMALASVGTDTGGSIRIPASLCGVVGFKPTYGLVPVQGVHPLAPTLDHVGPLTTCVEDAMRVMDVMTGGQTNFYECHSSHVTCGRVRVGIPRALVEEMASDDVGRWFEEVVDELERLNEITYVKNIPLDAKAIATHQGNIISAEAYATHATWLADHASDYGKATYERLTAAQQTTTKHYIHSLSARKKLQADVDHWFDDCDIMLLPTTPVTAQTFDTKNVHTKHGTQPLTQLMTRFTNPWNLTGCPAISLPIGTIKSLPIGLQMVGRYDCDGALLRAAHRIESRFTDHH